MTQDKREKLSDRSTTSIFGKEVTFQEAFPQIENFSIDIEEVVYTGYGGGIGRDVPHAKEQYDKNHLPREYFDCHNPRCYKGGFSIGSILRQMVHERQTYLETLEGCRGYEGSPKGRRKHRDCTNSFSVKITIKYKEDSPPIGP